MLGDDEKNNKDAPAFSVGCSWLASRTPSARAGYLSVSLCLSPRRPPSIRFAGSSAAEGASRLVVEARER